MNIPQKIIAASLFLFPVWMHAQADIQDLEKIKEVYKTADSYQLDMKYSLFKDYQSNIEEEGFRMNIFKDGNYYYCKRNAGEMLVNDAYTLVLDHSNKVLLIDQYRGAAKQSDELSNEMGIDSLLQLIAKELKNGKAPEVSIEQKQIGEQERQYILHYPEGEYTDVKMNYDASTFMIKKLILYYREKIEIREDEAAPRVEITYLQTDLHPEFDKKMFSERKYVHVKKNGELELSAGFSNYQVINHLSK